MSTFEPPVIPATTPGGRTVTVTGTAAATARPDRASVSLGVEARRATAADALDVAAQRAAALIGALRDAGVGDDDVRTIGVNLWHDQHERAYVASTQLQVRVPADEVGRHIDVAAAAAGDELTMHGVSFSVSDAEAVVAPLRAAALADARAKATALADAEGATAGVALTIVEGGAGGAVPLHREARAMMAADLPVESGSQSLTLSVTVTYELH